MTPTAMHIEVDSTTYVANISKWVVDVIATN
jgi:hypothetical protein